MGNRDHFDAILEKRSSVEIGKMIDQLQYFYSLIDHGSTSEIRKRVNDFCENGHCLLDEMNRFGCDISDNEWDRWYWGVKNARHSKWGVEFRQLIKGYISLFTKKYNDRFTVKRPENV